MVDIEQNARENRERIILIPGLWMPALSMWALGRKFRRIGFEVSYLNYSAVTTDWQVNVKRLIELIDGVDEPVVHIVAHSYGGLIGIRAVQHISKKIGKLICLGTPLHASRAAIGLARFRWGKILLGESYQLLSIDNSIKPTEHYSITMIAGIRGIGLGRLFARLPIPNDGAVALVETESPTLDKHCVVSVAHSQMLISRIIAQTTVQILRD